MSVYNPNYHFCSHAHCMGPGCWCHLESSTSARPIIHAPVFKPRVPAQYLTLVKAAKATARTAVASVLGDEVMQDCVLVNHAAWSDLIAALDACLDEEELG